MKRLTGRDQEGGPSRVQDNSVQISVQLANQASVIIRDRKEATISSPYPPKGLRAKATRYLTYSLITKPELPGQTHQSSRRKPSGKTG